MTISAIYPGIWAGSARQGPSDSHFSKVVNLSHFDGTNGSTTFVDNSPVATNLLANGSGALSTSAFKFGTASLRTGGTTDGANNALASYNVGTQDFTIEWWCNPDSIAASQNILFFDDGSTSGFYFYLTTGKIGVYMQSVERFVASAGITAAAWNFCAYSRIGTSGVLYVGGNNVGSWTDNLNYNSGANELVVGRTTASVNSFVGNFDDVRFTVGVGRYSGGTCPVPSAAFPNH